MKLKRLTFTNGLMSGHGTVVCQYAGMGKKK